MEMSYLSPSILISCRCGYGQCHYPNGNIYKGGWKDNKREGKGELFIFGHPLKLQGVFEDNTFTGGTFRYDDVTTPYPGEVSGCCPTTPRDWR